MEFLSTVKRDVSNLPGWRTKERLIVFESDDWGSIRMPSKEAFENLAKSGIDLFSDEGNRFNKYDSLATVQDLASLFGVLESVKDKTDRPAVFTPFALVANRFQENPGFKLYGIPLRTIYKNIAEIPRL